MSKADEVLNMDNVKDVYWRIQDSRYAIPETSASGWSDFSYEKGQVSFFANLINAIEMLLGGKDEWGNNYAEEIIEGGGKPSLVAAISKYESEDAPGAEVILYKPIELGRWILNKKELRKINKRL